ncbi:RNA-guided endonuclease InsQ/TnpB family protein [Chroococcidiopsis thermalis]|uniref:Transposase, IS605 OrfB family n=1 Tax=Chroococcidiopsis thermalis (strain PCC 7203) TaxID=251229 RepID=K9TV03_CHRTP|nr:RNA-guided endonuclease TnpB family protein [Chroococcidiopsis thermalis]AFY86380.1 transposase, IS605 OrfB family [Chroococcidiopsis thermalis PCC 7203]
MYQTKRLNLEKTEQLYVLARAAGELYSRTLATYWRIVRKKGIFLSQYGMEKLCISNQLHAHTSDAIVGNFYSSIKSANARKKAGSTEAKYPRRRKYFYKITWKSAAIKVKDGLLHLSNGKGNPALVIPWQWNKPKQVEIGWKKGKGYQLRATYPTTAIASPTGEKVAAIDQGEVRTATVYDGENTTIYSGRLMRSKVRYRAKTIARIDAKISKTKRGSKRRKSLVATKHRIIRQLDNQINDILHKQSSHLVSTLFKAGVQTVVIGDIRDIRSSIKYGAKTNQKLHSWSFGKYRWMVEYKAEKLSMKVVLQDEAYSSQTCPACGKRHKPSGRTYTCKCGFQFDRDGVGSYNIRAKYLGNFGSPVVGIMAMPSGVRFVPHLQCRLNISNGV